MAASAAARQRSGLTALYLGIFAALWLSVPETDPQLGPFLVAGSIVALLTAGAGGALVIRSRADGPFPRDTVADRKYLVIFAAELAAAGFGAMLLAVTHRGEYIPVLAAFVVGVHFWPLAPVLTDPALKVLAVLVCLAALAGLIAGLVSSVMPGEVVGAGVGVLLLGYALGALLRAGMALCRSHS
ncbi:hypothetical protein SAMN04489716_7133 [Actinoplanes derwentensis]|uniref:Uncharacterized protein n=1 Tax=Actinoplanes derwentensis TaxID=113562 RepID=A0A1H2CWL4_9ACTN|nr:hypothetical protein Ade03nite_68070 [Actinoplanes derwentensis]SDT74908.1 hypothetical protein SAMN04489716_7133 [Actinoplanes derwentensis]